MEHEDNANFGNYLQNAQQSLQHGNQNLVVGLDVDVDNNAGLVGNDGSGVGNDVGSDKYEGHEEQHNVDEDNEWKYIKEVHQNEKAELQAHAAGNGGSGDMSLKSDIDLDKDIDDDEDDDENMPSIKPYHDNMNNDTNGHEKHLAVDDGTDIMQVEMQITTNNEQISQYEEEEPSSLATNTTNGTSSLSENIQQVKHDWEHDLDNKENNDPTAIGGHINEANCENSASSILNPDAKEFVPSFNSNPNSPTTPDTTLNFDQIGEPAQLSAIPRLLLAPDEDDFVAQSPHKGQKTNVDFDAVSLPSEMDFDCEAARRPHELEKEDDLIGDGHLPNELLCDLPQDMSSDDNLKMEVVEPAAVDLVEDVMKQSIYIVNGEQEENGVELVVEGREEGIEDILNSVQPLPNDSDEEQEEVNENSVQQIFVDSETEAEPEQIRGEKELLHSHDEKDHLSHPPSIEEMQMNLQNEFNVSSKDMPLLPVDLDSVTQMQDSFYIEHEREQLQHFNHPLMEEPLYTIPTDALHESLLMDTSIPYESNTSNLAQPTQSQELDVQLSNDLLLNNDAKKIEYEADDAVTNTPSPHSGFEEKHLLEETKEQLVTKAIDNAQEFVDELEKKVENLLVIANNNEAYSNEEEAITANNVQEISMENIECNKEHEFEVESFEHRQQVESVHFDQSQEIEPEHFEHIEMPIVHEVLQAKNDTEIIEVLDDLSFNKESEIEKVSVQEATLLEPEPESKQTTVFEAEEEQVELVPTSTVAVEAVIIPESEVEIESVPVETENKVDDLTTEFNVGAAAIVATAAIATAAAASVPDKKTDAKKPTSATKTATANKAKVTATKKPETKKPAVKTSVTASTTATSARPRTAPVKTTSSASSGITAKKTVSNNLTTKTTTVTTTISKTTSPKTTTATATTTTASRMSGTTKTTSTITARKNITTTATSHGSVTASKPRPTSAPQPAKPNTLGLSATSFKPKITPRTTLTSQLRKTAAVTTTNSSSTTSNINNVKSPIKTSVSLANTAAPQRPKTTTNSNSSSKIFTARPAPKTTQSTSTVTAPRRSLNATTTAQTKSTLIRKTSPLKVSPLKSLPTGGTKSTTNSPRPIKSKDLIKPVTKTIKTVAKTATVEKSSPPQVNGDVDQEQKLVENGVIHAEQTYIQLNGEKLDEQPHTMQPVDI